MSRSRRDWVLVAGMFVSAASAAISSFDGLRSPALVAGWNPYMAALLPLTLDAYATTATRVWLADSGASVRARRFARRNAVGAVAASLLGNATFHAISAGLIPASWVVVVVVGAVPSVALGLVSHLAFLRGQAGPDGTAVRTPESVLSDASGTAGRTGRGTRYEDEDALLVAARSADAAYRAAHAGKPITRDALRAELRIGGQRATALLRRLRAEAAETSIPQHKQP